MLITAIAWLASLARKACRAAHHAYLCWRLQQCRMDALVTEAEFQAAPAKLRHLRLHILKLADRIDKLEALS